MDLNYATQQVLLLIDNTEELYDKMLEISELKEFGDRVAETHEWLWRLIIDSSLIIPTEKLNTNSHAFIRTALTNLFCDVNIREIVAHYAVKRDSSVSPGESDLPPVDPRGDGRFG